MFATDSAPAVETTLQIAADHYNRYPGEQVTLYIRFSAPGVVGARLQLAMPRVAVVETHQLPEGIPPTLPVVAEAGEDVIVLIPLETHFTAGEAYEIQVGVRLRTFYADQRLLFETRLLDGEANTLSEASLRLTVFGQGKYLQYLPEIYAHDDFMGRFLMLFESFWKPVNQQIDQVAHYFDPDLTPPRFVPWLSSWMGLPVDDNLPLERMRTLLKHAMPIFQRRGTLEALKMYLEIYTGGAVVLQERRAANFVLGLATTLGMGIALGTHNQPNSITILLNLDAAELSRTGYTPEVYERKIIELVRAMVPAHVSYSVKCAFHAQHA